jgi:hypothetical protein
VVITPPEHSERLPWAAPSGRNRSGSQPLADEVKAELDALWGSDRDEAEIEDVVDARLEQLGL